VTDTDAIPEPSSTRRPRKVRRGPILFVVIAAIVAGVVAQERGSSSSTAEPEPVVIAARAGVSVPPSDAVSSAWFCAEGTSQPGGRADETVIVASLARTRVDVTITVLPGGDAAPESEQLVLAPGEETRVRVADIVETPEPGVIVEATGGPAVVSHQLQHENDLAVEPCTRSAGTDWYFASGTTVDETQDLLALFNPFGDDAIVDVGLLTDTGVQAPDRLQAVVVPRRSRITIPVQDTVLRQQRLAMHVHARLGRIVAEHSEIFDGSAADADPARQGLAVSLGAESPALTWAVPAGTTTNGGIAVLSLANFSNVDARVDVSVVVVGEPTIGPETIRVPARSVVATDVTAQVPLDTEYVITATAVGPDGQRVPFVAELLASWAPRSASPGAASLMRSHDAARRWVVPQPDVDEDAFLTVYNPGPGRVSVARRDGASLDIAPRTAKVFEVVLGADDGALVVTAPQPIVVALTLLGDVGASISSAIPDPSYAG
jgi:hypothetical protein